MLSRFQFGGTGDDRGLWVMLSLLLLAVLLPTACLLYFINEAVDGQRRLAGQQLGNAYRGQLRLVSSQIDAFWEQRAQDLDTSAGDESPGAFFERCVRDGLADSVICLGRDGAPAYPSLAAPPQADPTVHQAEWMEARALEDAGKSAAAAQKYAVIADSEHDPSIAGRAAQARIRCLLRSGQKDLALRLIDTQFYALQSGFGLDLQGRLIAADEQLHYLQLVADNNPARTRHAALLQTMLLNYRRQMPSAQRLFLMDQMRALYFRSPLALYPTYGAERVAERVLSEGRASRGDAGMQPTGIADVWKMSSHDGSVVALFTTPTIRISLARILRNDPGFSLHLPGHPPSAEAQSIAAGTRLPGWQISLDLPAPFAPGAGAQRQIASYVWLGFLTIAAAAVLALLGGQALRRQMRIAHMKTDLVAAVSHELKTPLASMKLLVESLLSGDAFEPQRTRQYLQLVAQENSRLSRLIDNFLTFSRMERNTGRFDFARIQPAALARTALDSIGDRFIVQLKVADSLPPLYADADAMVTVLLNLLENAYKYSDDDRRIDLRVFLSDGLVCFAVQDNGIGLSERERKKIFRRFYQVDRRLTRHTGGVGLGLSIVEFIVKAHHGAVSVASSPGAGSTFTVSLPPSTSSDGAGTGAGA